MIKVDSLLYKIDQKLNKLSTNEHQKIQLEDKILALNEAQILLIKNKLSGFSLSSGMGMDSFNKRYEDLQKLVINYDDGKLNLTETNEELNEWSADVTGLDPKFMIYLGSFILADKDQCKNRIVWINNEPLKHGDLQTVLTNEHYKPSFEYQETCASISSDKISVYTDGEFIPSVIKIMYLRYPVYISKVGFIGFDGIASVNADCELDDYLEDELLNLTIRQLGANTENIAAMQSSQFGTQTSE